MKKFSYLCLLGLLVLPLPRAVAQDKSQDKPKTEEHFPQTSPIPVKVQIVFTEYQGDKKIANVPYTFTLEAETNHQHNASLRTGVRIPIETDSKDSKTTYLDIGANIDCFVRRDQEGTFNVTFSFDRSELFPNKSPEGERLVSEPNGLPLIHQFRMSEEVQLKDGQTADNMLATDPTNGHVMRVSVSINVIK